MNERDIKIALLRVCKAAGSDSDFDEEAFHALCDELKHLGRVEEHEEMQHRLDALHAMYEQACQQRDELMDQQRAQIAAMRGRLQ